MGSFNVDFALNLWHGARLSSSVPRKGRNRSRWTSMVNLREGWVELRVSRNWPAVTLSGVAIRVSSTSNQENTTFAVSFLASVAVIFQISMDNKKVDETQLPS